MRDGLADGERVVRIVHPVDRDEIRERMRDDGIDVDAAQKRGQLDMLAWPTIDLGNGGFDADHAIAMVEDVLIAEHKQGYSRVRIFGDWAFRAQVYMDDFISLEARLNTTMSKYDDPMICAYDLSRVSGGAVLAAMHTHPIVIIAGVLQQEPVLRFAGTAYERASRERWVIDSVINDGYRVGDQLCLNRIWKFSLHVRRSKRTVTSARSFTTGRSSIERCCRS
ncbi:MAG TPA: MEDS domain-containing protein [Thermoanaerobaculia bacterium]|nr:MEDS domain-containing protein [Thermoanaerobaculia bacterium]